MWLIHRLTLVAIWLTSKTRQKKSTSKGIYETSEEAYALSKHEISEVVKFLQKSHSLESYIMNNLKRL